MLLLLVSLLLPACELFEMDDPEPKPDSPSEVPASLAKKWTAGEFSMG